VKTNLNVEDPCFFYEVYGLAIRSEFPLPELRTVTPSLEMPTCDYDVTIRMGKVPEQIRGGKWILPYFQQGGTSCLIKINNICRFLLRNSNEVIVEVFEGVPLSDVRGFLFGSVLGALLHQRNILPFHLGAIDAPFGSVALTGQSGAGKSTLTMHIQQLTDWPVICDDVAITQNHQGKTTLVSGVNRVKVWEDALDALGLDSSGLARDVTRYNKFHVTGPNLFSNSKQELKVLFIIENGKGFSATRLSGAEKFRAVMNSIYRPELVGLYWKLQDAIELCAAIAQTITVIQVKREKTEFTAAEAAELILREVESYRREDLKRRTQV